MLNRILLGILFVMVGIIALTTLIIWLAPFLAIGLTCWLVWRFAIRPNLLHSEPQPPSYEAHRESDVLLLTDSMRTDHDPGNVETHRTRSW